MPMIPDIPKVFEWQASALFWEREAQRHFERDDFEAEAVAREKANSCWRACEREARAALAVA